MEALVVAGALIAGVALIAVIVLRRNRLAEIRRNSPPEAVATQRAPWTRGDVISLAGIVTGAAIGVAGLVTAGDSSDGPTAKELNAPSYAALLRAGPFSGKLPDGLEARGLADVQIGDASAAKRIDAMQLKLRATNPAIGAFAHYEVYPTSKAAVERAKARIALLKRIFGPSSVQGDASSYCSLGTIHGPTAWECGGTNGLVYAEAAVTPNGNAFQGLATGTAAALLAYAEERARVAAG